MKTDHISWNQFIRRIYQLISSFRVLPQTVHNEFVCLFIGVMILKILSNIGPENRSRKRIATQKRPYRFSCFMILLPSFWIRAEESANYQKYFARMV